MLKNLLEKYVKILKIEARCEEGQLVKDMEGGSEGGIFKELKKIKMNAEESSKL